MNTMELGGVQEHIKTRNQKETELVSRVESTFPQLGTSSAPSPARHHPTSAAALCEVVKRVMLLPEEEKMVSGDDGDISTSTVV